MSGYNWLSHGEVVDLVNKSSQCIFVTKGMNLLAYFYLQTVSEAATSNKYENKLELLVDIACLYLKSALETSSSPKQISKAKSSIPTFQNPRLQTLIGLIVYILITV